MPSSGMEWTGPWVARVLKNEPEIQAVKVLTPQVLEVDRSDYDTVTIGTIASSRVETSDFIDLLTTYTRIGFVTNVPAESFWTGDAIAFITEKDIGFGGIRDL